MSEGVVPCRADLALVGVSKEVYQSWDEAGRRVAMRYEADKMMFETQWRLVRHHVMWEGKRGRRMELGSMISIRSSTHNIVNRGARIHIHLREQSQEEYTQAGPIDNVRRLCAGRRVREVSLIEFPEATRLVERFELSVDGGIVVEY